MGPPAGRGVTVSTNSTGDLDQFQDDVDQFIRGTAGGYWNRFQILARLTEELGEVASALQRVEGLRPHKQEVDLGAEVGDVLFTLAAFANASGIRLSDVALQVMLKYEVRDGPAWRAAHGEST